MIMFWAILFIVLLIIEISTINLVSIWFAIGALITCVFSLFIGSESIQIFVFIFSSIIFLALTKPVVKKLRKKKVQAVNLDMVVGRIGIVTENIIPNTVGEVMVCGKKWSAISREKLLKDTSVKILKIDGVKLVVEKFKED